MGACGCGDGCGEFYVKTRGKYLGIQIIEPCENCREYTVGVSMVLLEKEDRDIAKEEQPELKFHYGLNGFKVVDFELAREMFVKEAGHWFKPEDMPGNELWFDMVFSDFILDILKRTVSATTKNRCREMDKERSRGDV